MDSNAQISKLLMSEASQPVSVRVALGQGERFLGRLGVASARLDAEVLLGLALDCRRERLYLGLDVPLGEGACEQYIALLRRRGQREPLAYITGRREFWSLDFLTTPGVLIPRPETELLVELALDILAEKGATSRVLDVGTGSGAIAVSVAKERAETEIWATDLSGQALAVARRNAQCHQVAQRVHFLHGDLFAPIRRWGVGFFDLIVSNPPYVPRGEIESLAPEVRQWEPRLALDGGEDGVGFYRRIVSEAHLFLTGRGALLLELGGGPAAEVLRFAESSQAYLPGAVYRDYAGMERAVVVRRLL